jgi:hypothetical protein
MTWDNVSGGWGAMAMLKTMKFLVKDGFLILEN